MRLVIEGFKSFPRKTKLELAPLTILVGPPSSGKSNLLEALTLVGYAFKILLEKPARVYGSYGVIGHLNRYIRGRFCSDLISRAARRGEATIELGPLRAGLSCVEGQPRSYFLSLQAVIGEGEPRKVEIGNLRGRLTLPEEISPLWEPSGRELSEVELLYSLVNILRAATEKKAQEPVEYVSPVGSPVLATLSVASSMEALPAPRLYGFDRMGVVKTFESGRTSSDYPQGYLSEFGNNAGTLLNASPSLKDKVNEVLETLARTRVLPLASGSVTFIEDGVDMGVAGVSDTVIRIVYGILALLSNRVNTIYIPLGGSGAESEFLPIKTKPVVLLEEPEAHLYPIAFEELATLIEEAVREKDGARIVITTHSGRLAGLLWNRLPEETRIYYVFREGSRSKIYRVEMSKLANELVTLEEIVTHPPALLEDLVEEKILLPLRG